MMQDINTKLGAITLMMRKSKKLTLKDVTRGEFSESLLAKFEKGESGITADKFILVLQNMNVFLDEFQSLLIDYSNKKEDSFRQDLAEAYPRRDIKEIKSILNFLEDKFSKEPKSIFNEINQCVVRAVLATAQGLSPIKSDLTFLMEYLENTSEWGRYEIWVFSNCLNFFDDNMLEYYGSHIIGKTTFYRSAMLNEQMVLRTCLNIIDTYLKRKELILAKKFINHLNNLDIEIDFLYEKLILKYHEAHYRYLTKDKDAIRDMKRGAEVLEYCGFEVEAESLYKEIENL